MMRQVKQFIFATTAFLAANSPIADAQTNRLELFLPMGHSMWVSELAATPDGRWVVSGAGDGRVILWDTDARRQIRVFKTSGAYIRAVAIDSDGTTVMAADDKDIYVWSVSDGKRVLSVPFHENVTIQSVSLLVASAHKSSAVLHTLRSGKDSREILAKYEFTHAGSGGPEGISTRVDFEGGVDLVYEPVHSETGDRALRHGYRSIAKLWDTKTGQIVANHDRPGAQVFSVSISRRGEWCMFGYDDGKVAIWDAEAGKLVRQFDVAKEPIRDIGFSSNSRYAFATSDTRIVVWDVQKLISVYSQSAKDGQSFGFSNSQITDDGKRLISSHGKNSVAVHTLEPFRESGTLQGLGEEINCLAIDRSDTHLLAGQGSLGVCWDLEAGRPVRVLEGHTKPMRTLALDKDGSRAVTGGWDRKAIVWELTSGKALHSIEHKNAVDRCGLTADGSIATTLTMWKPDKEISKDFDTLVKSLKTEVTTWDTKSGKLSRSYFDKFLAFSDIVSNDGARIIGIPDAPPRALVVLDLESGRELQSIELADGEYVLRKPLIGYSMLEYSDADRSWIMAQILDVGKVEGRAVLSTKVFDVKTGKKHVSGTWPGSYEAETLPRFGTPVALSPDGASALFSGRDRRNLPEADASDVMHYRIEAGKKSSFLKGHTGLANCGVFSRNGRFAFTGSADGTIRIWDLATSTELCALITIEDGKEWLVVTPDGYFDGSPNAAKHISYRNIGSNELISLERYRKQFERPGLLNVIMKGEDYRGASAVTQDLPPKVRITFPAAKAESKDGKFVIEAEAESRGQYAVQQFRLMVNGRPWPAKLGVFDVPDPKVGKAKARWEVQLEPGKHTIEVLAYTKAVFASSEGIEIRHVGGDVPAISLPKMYILAVGISKYPKPLTLDYAHRDAEAVATAFQQHSKGLFQSIETKVLIDEKATREAVLDGLDWLRRSMTQRDFGVFYFGGHGLKDERDVVYFLPVDGVPQRLTRTAIDGSVLAQELTSTVGQLTVILDACHSGAAGGNKTRGITDGLLRDLTSPEKGVAMMCSASGLEQAQESHEFRHGLFTVALLEGLSGTGNRKTGMDELKVRVTDGAVYFKQLDGYVTDRVKQLSAGRQHPVTSVPRAFREFPVSKP